MSVKPGGGGVLAIYGYARIKSKSFISLTPNPNVFFFAEVFTMHYNSQ